MLSGGNYDRKFLHFLFSRCCSSCIALDILCTFFFSWKEKLQNWLHNFSMPATMESQKVSSQCCNFSRSLTQCTTVEVNRIKNLWKTCSSFTRERSGAISRVWSSTNSRVDLLPIVDSDKERASKSISAFDPRQSTLSTPASGRAKIDKKCKVCSRFSSPCREAKKFNLN